MHAVSQTIARFSSPVLVLFSSDVVWSDPNDLEPSWTPSLRHLLDAGECYGADVCTQFLLANNLDLVCRAHQLAMEGYFYSFEKKNSLTGSLSTVRKLLLVSHISWLTYSAFFSCSLDRSELLRAWRQPRRRLQSGRHARTVGAKT